MLPLTILIQRTNKVERSLNVLFFFFAQKDECPLAGEGVKRKNIFFFFFRKPYTNKIMDKSFANLLRHSRLASFDRSLEQVYTSPKRFRKTGDWGLKRNLPTVIRTRFVEIKRLDTAEHQTPWESGDSKVLFLKRWKENFPNSSKPKSGTVVGPTYSDYKVDWNYPVVGRVLNSDRTGFAVGIGGVVAHMSKRDAVGLRNSGERAARTFYVRNAEIDENGNPKVEVALTSGEYSYTTSLLNDGFPTKQNPKIDMTVREMMNEGRKTDSEDNIIPNPEHTELMARIASLLDSGKKQ